MQKGCRNCKGEKELEFEGARHVLDRRLGSRVLIVQCVCGSMHYRLPLAHWADLEADIARAQETA